MHGDTVVARRVSVDEDREHRGAGPHGEQRQALRRRGRTAEERYEDTLAARGVLVQQDPDHPPVAERRQYRAERAALDKIINEFSIDWPLDRLGKVDHSILRLALSELKAGATPVSVIIDEAVELAKKYSGNESAKFINGILGAFLRKA